MSVTAQSDEYRAGFVAVVGRPNVGKSTLVNAIAGAKVSIVTSKPQTTRHRILAVDNGDDYQAVYVDTPGLHREAKKAMNRLMNRTAASALADADVVLFLTEAGRFTAEDEDVLARLPQSGASVLAVLNKVDRVHPKTALLEHIDAMAKRRDFDEIVPLCARRHDDVQRLRTLVPGFLPISPPLFPRDVITDRSDAFRAAEIVREKLIVELRQEVPYGLTVEVERYERADDGASIHAVVWVERDSQKGIVVGKGGQLLKRIGRAARLELKHELGMPVHLELWVKVKDNWADNVEELKRLGFENA